MELLTESPADLRALATRLDSLEKTIASAVEALQRIEAAQNLQAERIDSLKRSLRVCQAYVSHACRAATNFPPSDRDLSRRVQAVLEMPVEKLWEDT